MGRFGRIPGTRELIVPGLPYIVPYRIRDEIVEILLDGGAKPQSPDVEGGPRTKDQEPRTITAAVP